MTFSGAATMHMKTLKTLVFAAFITTAALAFSAAPAQAAASDYYIKEKKEAPEEPEAAPEKPVKPAKPVKKAPAIKKPPLAAAPVMPIDPTGEDPLDPAVPETKAMTGDEAVGVMPKITPEMIDALIEVEGADPVAEAAAGKAMLGSPIMQQFMGPCTEEDKKKLKEMDDNIKGMKANVTKADEEDQSQIYSYFQDPESMDSMAEAIMRCGLSGEMQAARNYSDEEIKKMEKENQKILRDHYSEDELEKLKEEALESTPEAFREMQVQP
jgi:hypothetical protein